MFLTVAVMIAAYFAYNFFKVKLNPRKSFGHFILFVIATFFTIFFLIFLLSLVLFIYKDFFFKH